MTDTDDLNPAEAEEFMVTLLLPMTTRVLRDEALNRIAPSDFWSGHYGALWQAARTLRDADKQITRRSLLTTADVAGTVALERILDRIGGVMPQTSLFPSALAEVKRCRWRSPAWVHSACTRPRTSRSWSSAERSSGSPSTVCLRCRSPHRRQTGPPRSSPLPLGTDLGGPSCRVSRGCLVVCGHSARWGRPPSCDASSAARGPSVAPLVLLPWCSSTAGRRADTTQ